MMLFMIMEAEMKRNKIMEQFKSISEDSGSVKLLQVGEILDRLWPKNETSLPTAKKNH